LFGPTQKWFFAYPENVNLGGEYADCPYCHNQKPFWMSKCVKNGKSPYCLAFDFLEPQVVVDEIGKLLKKTH
jgi:hypothetical protein